MKSFSVDGDRWKLLLFWTDDLCLEINSPSFVSESLPPPWPPRDMDMDVEFAFFEGGRGGFAGGGFPPPPPPPPPPFDVVMILFVERMKIHVPYYEKIYEILQQN